MNRSVGIILAAVLVSACIATADAAAKKGGKAPAAPPAEPLPSVTVPVGSYFAADGNDLIATKGGVASLVTGDVVYPVGGGGAGAAGKGKKPAKGPAAPAGPSYNQQTGTLTGLNGVMNLPSYDEIRTQKFTALKELASTSHELQEANETLVQKNEEIEQGLNPLGSKVGNIALVAGAAVAGAVASAAIAAVVGRKMGKASAQREIAAQLAEEAQAEQLQREASAMGHVVSGVDAAEKTRVPTEAVVADMHSETAKGSRRSQTATSDVKSRIVSEAVKDAVVAAAVRSAVDSTHSSKSKSNSGVRL